MQHFGLTELEATNKAGKIDYSYSNIVDITAHGKDIFSDVPGGSAEQMSGTSMAAPHVADAFALLRQRAPLASSLELEKSLRELSESVVDTRNDLRVARLDMDGAPSLPVAVAKEPLSSTELFATPAVGNPDSLGAVVGLRDDRFVVRASDNAKVETLSLQRALNARAEGAECSLQQIGADTWIVRVRQGTSKDSVSPFASATKLQEAWKNKNLRVFEDSASLSEPLPEEWRWSVAPQTCLGLLSPSPLLHEDSSGRLHRVQMAVGNRSLWLRGLTCHEAPGRDVRSWMPCRTHMLWPQK